MIQSFSFDDQCDDSAYHITPLGKISIKSFLELKHISEYSIGDDAAAGANCGKAHGGGNSDPSIPLSCLEALKSKTF